MGKLEDLIIYMMPAGENTAIVNNSADEIEYTHNFTLDSLEMEMDYLIDNYDINTCLIFGPEAFISKPAEIISNKYNILVKTEGM